LCQRRYVSNFILVQIHPPFVHHVQRLTVSLLLTHLCAVNFCRHGGLFPARGLDVQSWPRSSFPLFDSSIKPCFDYERTDLSFISIISLYLNRKPLKVVWMKASHFRCSAFRNSARSCCDFHKSPDMTASALFFASRPGLAVAQRNMRNAQQSSHLFCHWSSLIYFGLFSTITLFPHSRFLFHSLYCISTQMRLWYSAALTFASAILFAKAHPSLGSALASSLIPRATTCNGHAELCNRSFGNVTFVGAHDSYAIGINNRTSWFTSTLLDLLHISSNPEFFYSSRSEPGSIQYVVQTTSAKGV